MQTPENVDPKVWQKMLRVLNDTVVEELEASAEEDLRKTIARCERNIAEQEEARRADRALSAAKEQVKDLGAAYSDAIKFQRAKQRLAAHLLEAKGKL